MARLKVSPDQAFNIFVNLGPDRSLDAVHREIQRIYGCKPATSTLKSWSSKFGWQDRAHEFDRQCQAEASREAIKIEAGRRVDIARALRELGIAAVDRLRQAVGEVEIHTAEEFKTLADAVVAIFREADALEGMRPVEMAPDDATDAGSDKRLNSLLDRWDALCKPDDDPKPN